MNALRSVLYEYGYVFTVGLAHLKRIATLLEDPGCSLPGMVITECEDLLEQIGVGKYPLRPQNRLRQ